MTKKGFPKSAADTLAIGPKFWQMYRELGEAVENSNRIAVFKAAQAKGKSIAEAVYETKDLMDYSLQGSWTAVRLLADVVPVRSEERRVGKGCVSKCRCRWEPEH